LSLSPPPSTPITHKPDSQFAFLFLLCLCMVRFRIGKDLIDYSSCIDKFIGESRIIIGFYIPP
ncbi:MAG TPA: hypothetical protein VIK14_13160, partial [Ignavibacteria bacterium]